MKVHLQHASQTKASCPHLVTSTVVTLRATWQNCVNEPHGLEDQLRISPVRRRERSP